MIYRGARFDRITHYLEKRHFSPGQAEILASALKDGSLKRESLGVLTEARRKDIESRADFMWDQELGWRRKDKTLKVERVAQARREATRSIGALNLDPNTISGMMDYYYYGFRDPVAAREARSARTKAYRKTKEETRREILRRAKEMGYV